MKRILFTLLIVAVCCGLASCEKDSNKLYVEGYHQNLSGYKVKLSGKADGKGAYEITEVGFCYQRGANGAPDVHGSHIACGYTEGEFSCVIDRYPSDPLTYRAYAKVSTGKTYYGGNHTIYPD